MSTVFANSRVGLALAGSNGSGFTLAEESHSDHLLEPAEAERWMVVREGRQCVTRPAAGDGHPSELPEACCTGGT